MPSYAFYFVSEDGKSSFDLVDAQNLEAAKAVAMEAIKDRKLRALRLWDGHRAIEINRPVRPAPVARPRKPDLRGAEMLAMKAGGKTLREIGARFGISTHRVQEIIARVRFRARLLETEPNRAALSGRAQNLLLYLIEQPEADPSERDRLLPERVAALTPARLLAVPNAGKKTIAEIEAWLWDRGHGLGQDL